jgi:hypothetical protein
MLAGPVSIFGMLSGQAANAREPSVTAASPLSRIGG